MQLKIPNATLSTCRYVGYIFCGVGKSRMVPGPVLSNKMSSQWTPRNELHPVRCDGQSATDMIEGPLSNSMQPAGLLGVHDSLEYCIRDRGELNMINELQFASLGICNT